MLDSRLTFSPKANTASPAAKMLRAALMSRSWSAPHSGQDQRRTSSASLSNTCPQSLHRLVLGNHWSIATNVRPAQSALYASCRVNSPPASVGDSLTEIWIADQVFDVQRFGTDHLVIRAAVALLLGLSDKALTPDEVKAILVATSWNGEIDLEAALNAVD